MAQTRIENMKFLWFIFLNIMMVVYVYMSLCTLCPPLQVYQSHMTIITYRANIKFDILTFSCSSFPRWCMLTLRNLNVINICICSRIFLIKHRRAIGWVFVRLNNNLFDVNFVQDWGRPGDLWNLEIQWHVPSVEEISLAFYLLDLILQPELQRLKRFAEGEQDMSR